MHETVVGNALLRQRLSLICLLIGVITSACARPDRRQSFDVRRFGTRGDGVSLDTDALNAAITACATAGGGEVMVPAGRYLTGTVHLRSDVALRLDEGAEIVGTPDLDHYASFTPPPNCSLPPPRWHRALVLGENVHNVTITGRGVIDGASVCDPKGEEHIRGPHAILIANSRDVSIRDITVRDAGNYAVLMEFTRRAAVRGVTITGGYDGVHLRGWIDHPCRDVTIRDCSFETGDDCIAGWYWQDTRIERCTLNSSCNGVRLFGPARGVTIRDCIIVGPGKSPWRTSGLLHHTSMLAGLCIQPGAWADTPGIVDDVHVSNVTMRNVATPFHIATRSPSTIGRILIDHLTATGIYRAAGSVESWSALPIERFEMRDSMLSFTGGFGPVFSDPGETAVALATSQSRASPQDVQPPGVNPRALPAWGLYVRHVRRLCLDHVELKLDRADPRPPMIDHDVATVEMADVIFPPREAGTVTGAKP